MNDFFEKIVQDKNSGTRILIAMALFMAAGLIGYNAFFSKNAVEITQTSEISEVSEQHEEAKNEIININTASEQELEKLNGIGESMAKRIINYRETHGGFSSKEEIMNVKGIGRKVFENIKKNICV